MQEMYNHVNYSTVKFQMFISMLNGIDSTICLAVHNVRLVSVFQQTVVYP